MPSAEARWGGERKRTRSGGGAHQACSWKDNDLFSHLQQNCDLGENWRGTENLCSMNEVVHTSPTIGSNVEEVMVNNTHFLMWDIGGQESLRSSWNTYYTNTEFVIVVVDSTDRERIAITRDELYKMLAHEDLKRAGLMIFANKQDVKEGMTVAEISQYLKLTSIKDHQWHIQACCALTGEGLCQGLEWMTSRLKIR
ncbi:ADP-ribosylation factor-like protein 5A isoform X1 [Callorhinchus milii]|uniref:ADP-ribosylation factor-like protein 5A isoform X1 n=1 Tax=Callorhinchus milii TaxID=7868 RepID=UPI001C3FE1B1|nr:ADP-ribosylation factor-like protein 5A isoform X1 [Callorhinchus milii]